MRFAAAPRSMNLGLAYGVDLVGVEIVGKGEASPPNKVRTSMVEILRNTRLKARYISEWRTLEVSMDTLLATS
jgi:hypothetical protein